MFVRAKAFDSERPQIVFLTSSTKNTLLLQTSRVVW